MVRRLVASMGLTIVIVFVSVHVAAAKGTLRTHALVTGPGISSPLRIDGDEAEPLLPMWHGAWWPDPPSSLGPRYEVQWEFDYAPPAGVPASDHARDGLIVFELYPFAKGGPWARVPLGQHDTGGFVVIEHEWYSMPFATLDVLRKHGFRAQPPVPPTKAAATAKSDSGPRRPWVLPAVASILALALLLVAAFARHHERSLGRAMSADSGRPNP